MFTSIEIKASILSKGVSLTNRLIDNFGNEFLEKRRAYGNGDPLEYRQIRVPQELYIEPDGERLVAAVNIRKKHTPWQLDYEDNKYFLRYENDHFFNVTFPLRPDFYHYRMSNNKFVSQVITLYGGGSLGIFAYGKCNLVEIGKPCHYCSISQNRDKGTDFVLAISDLHIEEALMLSLKDSKNKVTQVMLNGGNFPDMNKSFLHYVHQAVRITEILKKANSNIETHLIVFPPKDLGLLRVLEGTDISIAMNTEIFDPMLFEKYCPGKVETAGREHILKALETAAKILPPKKVYSIFVGGLEPVESLRKGLHFLADRGVTPVINVLHTDPETPLENFPNPSENEILQMGEALQQIYTEYHFTPFYKNCGRNSIDTESYKKLFY